MLHDLSISRCKKRQICLEFNFLNQKKIKGISFVFYDGPTWRMRVHKILIRLVKGGDMSP